jgi:predicted RNA-binding protein with TRAM domain
MSYSGSKSYGGGYGGFGGPKPVQTGKEYDVQITEISRQGDGIARIQGFVIFVKGGKPGQQAKIRVTRVGDRFANADIANAAATGTSGTTPEGQAQEGGKGDEAPSA